jgi:multicomponent Na+:H+ antiporter subunit E
MTLAPAPAVVLRAAGFFAIWIMLAAGGSPDLPAGLAAGAIATWASLRLSAPGAGRLRPAAAGRLVVHLLRQSVVSGTDVAWRALEPRLSLRPGFVTFAGRLAPGSARNVFTALMSLLPGTVPAGPGAGGGIVIHCLDVEQPVAVQLAAEEALFAHVVAAGSDG